MQKSVQNLSILYMVGNVIQDTLQFARMKPLASSVKNRAIHDVFTWWR